MAEEKVVSLAVTLVAQTVERLASYMAVQTVDSTVVDLVVCLDDLKAAS